MDLVMKLFIYISLIFLLSCCKDEHRVYYKGSAIPNLFVFNKDYVREYLSLNYS